MIGSKKNLNMTNQVITKHTGIDEQESDNERDSEIVVIQTKETVNTII